MAQYHSGRSKKRVILDGRNPGDVLAWEGYIRGEIRATHGEIGVEHWRGRHPYTLMPTGGDEGSYKNPYKATRKEGEPLRAPSPIGGGGEEVDDQKVTFIAHRSLMEDMFQTDPGGVVKMSVDSLEFFKGQPVQEKLYEKRESFVKSLLLENTGGDVKVALQNADYPNVKTAFEHAEIVKSTCGTVPAQLRQKLISRLREAQIHSEDFIGMKAGEDPAMFIQVLVGKRSEILQYTPNEDREQAQIELSDDLLIETVKRSITIEYKNKMEKFDELAKEEKTISKLTEILQKEYHDNKDFRERAAKNAKHNPAVPTMTITEGGDEKKKRACWTCGSTDHIKANCPKRDKRGGGGSSKGNHANHKGHKPWGPCRFGKKCFRTDCKFKHPEGWSAQKAKEQYQDRKRDRDGDGADAEKATKFTKVFTTLRKAEDGEISLPDSLVSKVADLHTQFPNMFMTTVVLSSATDDAFTNQQRMYGFVKYAVWDSGAGVCITSNKKSFIPGTLCTDEKLCKKHKVQTGGETHECKGMGCIARPCQAGEGQEGIPVMTTSVTTGWYVPSLKGFEVNSETAFESFGLHALRATPSDPKMLQSSKRATEYRIPVLTKYGIQVTEILNQNVATLHFEDVAAAVEGGLHRAYRRGTLPSNICTVQHQPKGEEGGSDDGSSAGGKMQEERADKHDKHDKRAGGDKDKETPKEAIEMQPHAEPGHFAGLDVKRKSRLQLARFGYVDPKFLYKMAKDGTIDNFEFPHALGDEDFAIQTMAHARKKPHKRRLQCKTTGEAIDDNELDPFYAVQVDAMGPFQVKSRWVDGQAEGIDSGDEIEDEAEVGQHKIHLDQGDIEQAYLNAQADKVYYIHIPMYVKYAEMSIAEITKERARLMKLRKENQHSEFEEAKHLPFPTIL
eukprot:g5357.t1